MAFPRLGFRIAPFILLLVLTVSLGACASKPDPVSPHVRVIGLRVLPQGNLLEQRLEVTLRISNPNDFSLTLDGMRFWLDLNGREFAHGLGNERVKIGRLDEASYHVVVSTGLVEIIVQLTRLGGKQGIDYTVRGDVFVRGAGVHPFERSGTLQLLSGGRNMSLGPF